MVELKAHKSGHKRQVNGISPACRLSFLGTRSCAMRHIFSEPPFGKNCPGQIFSLSSTDIMRTTQICESSCSVPRSVWACVLSMKVNCKVNRSMVVDAYSPPLGFKFDSNKGDHICERIRRSGIDLGNR